MKFTGSFKIKGKNDSETEFEFELIEGSFMPSDIYDIVTGAIIASLEINYKDHPDKIINKDMKILKCYMP